MTDYAELVKRLRTAQCGQDPEAAAAIEQLAARVAELEKKRDEALQLAEGPSTLMDLAATAFARGCAVVTLEAELREQRRLLERNAARVEVERLRAGKIGVPAEIKRWKDEWAAHDLGYARGAIEALEKIRKVFAGYQNHDSIKVIGILECIDAALRAARESKEKA